MRLTNALGKTVLLSFVVGTVALFMSVMMILIAVPLLGDTFQKTMFVNSVIGCYFIGSPVTYYCLRQADKLRVVNAKLDEMRSRLEVSNELLVQKIRIDQMTGLLNREYFLEEVKSCFGEENAGSLLIIDADNFKAINDRWGHLCGDDALIKMTRAIQSAVRRRDVVGRIGGEEFAVFLPGAAPEIVGEVAERIRSEVEKIEFIPVNEILPHPLTVSIGGVEISGLANMAQVMGTADRNLYKAKNSGRNQVVFSHKGSVYRMTESAA